MRHLLFSLSILIAITLTIQTANARDFPYKRNVTLKVGQSTVLKGVRDRDCGDKAPSWSRVKRKLPGSSLGRFSNGGAGTVKSRKCGKRVGARGVRFKATKRGEETLTIYKDRVHITVK